MFFFFNQLRSNLNFRAKRWVLNQCKEHYRLLMDCWGNLIKSSNVDGRKKKDRTRVVRDKLDGNGN